MTSPTQQACRETVNEEALTVKYIRHMGEDRDIAMFAWSSTDKWEQAHTCPEENIVRIINALMRGRHASPFGHDHITFYIVAPLWIWTQILRHRSWASFSLLSLRYTWQWLKTYVPHGLREANPDAKQMAYQYRPMRGWRNWLGLWTIRAGYALSMLLYWQLHRLGIANELARVLIPQGALVRGFGTVSVRNLINFLVLRNEQHAQEEIQYIAREMEVYLRYYWPITHRCWNTHGRPQL